MFEFVQVSAQYSNAVLLAILPHVSEFSQKLDLSVRLPVRPEFVERFNCDPRKGQIGGWLRLTNGFEFWYQDGFVKGFAAPDCYYRLQNPVDLTSFYGPVGMSKLEAIQLARDSLRKLGYSETTLYADGTPEVTRPPTIKGKVVPRYRIEWIEPEVGAVCLDIEIDAQHKKLKSMQVSNGNLWRAPPPISFMPQPLDPGQTPEFLKDAPPALVSMYHQIPPSSGLTQQEQQAALSAILSVVSDFARKLALPIHLPVITNQVASFDSQFYPNQAYLSLTNGYQFVYSRGYIQEFRAPHSFFGVPKLDGKIEDYWGAWHATEKDALRLAREAVEKLGYSLQALHLDKKPKIKKPLKIGQHDIPRYCLNWEFTVSDPEEDEQVGILSATQIEVDADSRTVKAISIYDAGLTRPFPVFNPSGDSFPAFGTNVPAQMKFLTNAPAMP